MKKIIASAMLLAAPIASQASDWEYSVTPYLWLPTISIDSARVVDKNSSNDGPLDIGPTDYLEALDFGFMITGEARNDKLVMKGDLIYLDFSVDDKDGKWGGNTFDASLKGTVPTILAGMNVIKTSNYHMDVLAGWRRADLDLKFDRSARLTPFSPLKKSLTYDDFLVAINGEYQFSDTKWSMPYYADIGAGDSDMTWQALIGIDYAFESWKLHLNYRHLDYDFGDMGNATLPIMQDVGLVFSGPSIGAKFEF
jgi:opacity protein-like surface antigen